MSYLSDSLGDFFVTATKLFQFFASAVTAVGDAADLSLEERQSLLQLVDIGIQMTVLLTELITLVLDGLDALIGD